MKKLKLTCIFVVFCFLISFCAYGKKISGIDTLEINFEPLPLVLLPLDKIIKYKFNVKNSGTKTLIVDFDGEIVEPFKQVLGSVTPEPKRLYLEPGKSAAIIAKFDEKWGKLPNFIPGSNPIPGKYQRKIQWTFTDVKNNKKKNFFVTIEYTVLNDQQINGDFNVSGKVVDDRGVPKTETKVILSTGNWKTSTTTNEEGNFSFINLPKRNDWLLTATEDLNDPNAEHCIPQPPPGPACPKSLQKRAFAFVHKDQSNYQLVMKDPLNKGSFHVLKSMKTDIGFWTGDVDEDENFVLLINGMENWNKIPKSESRLFLFTLNGELVWTYDLPWEGWNADLSSDGKYAAFVTSGCSKKTKCPFGVLATQTGQPLWINQSKNIKVTEFPELDTKEIQISNNNKYLAVGGVDGTLILFELKTGKILWSQFIYGQIRGILFDKNDKFIYAGTGDRNAYKLRVEDGSVVWKTNIGSWPYVGAFKLTNDENLLASGGKYGDLTVIQTQSGEIHFYEDMKDIVSWLDFSPDGKYLIAGGGGQYATTLFDIENSKKVWRLEGFTHQGNFSPDGKYIMMGDKNIRLVDISGNDLARITSSEKGCRPGCGGIFSYVSKDGSKIIFTRRDIDPSDSVFFLEGKITEASYVSSSKTQEPINNVNKLKPKPEDAKDPSIFTPEQMQCLMEVFGPERANSLSSRRPTAEESHEMGPCMAL